MNWIWILIAAIGLATVGQGLLMIIWSVFEIIRQAIFGHGIDDSPLPPGLERKSTVKGRRYDNGGN